MGRRKIEIQPITHERNRTVTFLKRKNGLFKKAYELGVLCSVDVAVIIFEERPGHEIKLHTYSSSDLRDIVQRQLRHQGERDGRGPGDFSGAGTHDDDNDDGGDDDDESPSARVSGAVGKRKASSKLSMPSEMSTTNSEYNVRNNGHPLGHNLGGGRFDEASGSIGSLMPVSNSRISSLRDSHSRGSKRLRTGTGDTRSRSASLDRDRRGGGGVGGPELYLPTDTPISYGGRLTRSMRQAHEQAQNQNVNISMQNTYHSPGNTFGTPYAALFPSSSPANQNFNHGQFGHHEPQYDPALYQQQQSISRHQQGEFVPVRGTPMEREQRLRDALLTEERERQDRGRGGPGGPGERERGGGDMFAAFLEADEQSRQMAAAQRQLEVANQHPGSTGGTSLDWPTSRTGGPEGSSSRGLLDLSNPAQTNPSSGSWFDLFSGGGPSNLLSNLGAQTSKDITPASGLDPLGHVAHILGTGGGGAHAQASGNSQTGTGGREPLDVEDADGEGDVDMEAPIAPKPPAVEEQKEGDSAKDTNPQADSESGAKKPTKSKANDEAKA